MWRSPIPWVCLLSPLSVSAGDIGGETLGAFSIPAGQSIVIEFDAAVSNPVPAGTDLLSNSATITADDLSAISTSDPDAGTAEDPNSISDAATDTAVDAAPVLGLSKDDGAVTILPGGTVSYTLQATNSGNEDATGVQFSETVPTGTRFNATSSTAGWSCSDGAAAGTPCTFNAASDLAGGGGSTNVVFAVDETISGLAQISNSADVSASNAASAAMASDTTPVSGSSDPGGLDLAITKTNGVDHQTPGGQVTYTLVVTNSGPGNALSARITDTFPASLGSISWSCTATSGSSCGASGSGDIDDTVSLLNGGRLTYTATATLDSAARGQVSNTAVATVGSDNDNGNNSATDTDSIVFDPPTGLKTANDAGGSELLWRMVWINSGNHVANRVRVIDPIPSGSDYVAASLSCVPQGASPAPITCTYDAANDQIIYEGDIHPDFGQTTESGAANEVVIGFRTSYPGGLLVNQASASWDEDGDGAVDGSTGTQSERASYGSIPAPIPLWFGGGAALLALLLAATGLRQLRFRSSKGGDA